MKFNITLLFIFLVLSLYGELNKAQKEYLSQYGGYYRDLLNENEKLTRESIKLGIKIYGYKDKDADNSFKNYIHEKNSGEQTNIAIELAKYNELLNEYYYPQLALLNKYQEKIDFSEDENEKEKYREHLNEIDTYYKILLNAITTEDLNLKKKTYELMIKRDKYESLKNKKGRSNKEQVNMKRLKKNVDELIKFLSKI